MRLLMYESELPNAALSARLTEAVTTALGVGSERVFVVMTDVPRHLWAHAGKTFG